jgi:hypothetical protein
MRDYNNVFAIVRHDLDRHWLVNYYYGGECITLDSYANDVLITSGLDWSLEQMEAIDTNIEFKETYKLVFSEKEFLIWKLKLK